MAYGAFNCLLFDHQVAHPYVLSMKCSFFGAGVLEQHVGTVL